LQFPSGALLVFSLAGRSPSISVFRQSAISDFGSVRALAAVSIFCGPSGPALPVLAGKGVSPGWCHPWAAAFRRPGALVVLVLIVLPVLCRVLMGASLVGLAGCNGALAASSPQRVFGLASP